MKITLKPDVAPMHVSSTIYLTRLGFYDGLTFHRVIPKFMAQGGDPLGTGTGGPGYRYDGEFAPDAKHDKRGTLSMAHAGPGTDGSQFFITFGPTPHLDQRHTVFGEVTDGVAVLDKIEAAGSASGATSEPITIVKATIVVE
jgi:cyclophilin family peptidyl-prolyl cis-trans isomerase